MQQATSGSSEKPTKLLLLIGILCVAINLRPALAGVGPLIGSIKESTGLSNSLLGLLTTLPLIAFATISIITPLFTKKFGIGGSLFGAMLLLMLGIGIRSIDWVPALYIGTVFLGIAIAFGNVLLPSLTKRNFSERSGFITSLYSSVMALGASLAAGLSVPLAEDFGWRGSLGIWAALAFIAVLVWLPQVSRLKKSVPSRRFADAMKNMSRSRLAWQVALFMGLQSLTFYVVLAWLPAILQSRGFDASFSGWMLSLCQATGILGSLMVPVFAGGMKNQRGIVLVLGIIEMVGLSGLLIPILGPVAIWVSLLGFVLGGTFGLALLFIVLRSADTESATELSGMAQSIGYFVAATGPLIFGAVFDFTHTWTYPIALLFIVALLKLVIGLGAGRSEKVGG